MPNRTDERQTIATALQGFAAKPLAEAARALFAALGYQSAKRLKLAPNTAATFLATFAEGKTLNDKSALTREWKSVDFLFQVTDEEIRSAGGQQFLFESQVAWNGATIESYVFLSLELAGKDYTRTALAGITRELKKLFAMPALVLFRHGDRLTLAIINRRLHNRDAAKDVLEKVTLIRDIEFARPHRAHIEILFDLSFAALHEKYDFNNFVKLHAAWQKTLDISSLNKRFYQELANWYFWALDHVRFPRQAPKDADDRDSLSLIRLITRVIFCWFLKEKGLLPAALFDPRKVPQLLAGFDSQESSYYKAILQNLFFATLNQEMGRREFRRDGQNFMAHNLYRHRRLLRDPDEVLALFASIPFMNGGLFECLDKIQGTKEKPVYTRIDGFSDRDDSSPDVPNELFFSDEREVDLIAAYGEARYRKAKVRGLIHILDRYKFTIAENTPIEEEVALDPELLGQVFENLLAAYNPETGATARKQTGSFYTPRAIVHYMVDESLIASLAAKLEAAHISPLPRPWVHGARGEAQGVRASNSPRPSAVPSRTGEGQGVRADIEERLRDLFAYNDQPHKFSSADVGVLIEAIDHLKILDPACGSGAFPMGILHKLVFVLGKLDPGNERWKARQLAKAGEIPDATVRERVLADIEQSFNANELDYGRKLYLIENCIYGVDIQPIAVQISKLRFFISLIVDQKVSGQAENLGIRPLPNLETKFVAANTLIGIERPGQQLLRNERIDDMEADLRRVRERHFSARTPPTKAKYREQDAGLRAEIAEKLKEDDWDTATATKLANWDPYDQNASAEFFDPEWMFGICVGKLVHRAAVTLTGKFSVLARGELTPQTTIAEGFDVVIGNPPYVRQEAIKELKPALKAAGYECFSGTADLLVYFYERGVKLLRAGGTITLITSNKFYRAGYGEKLRCFLTRELTLRRLIDFGDAPVFDAIAYASILSGSRAASPPNASLLAYTWGKEMTFDRITAVVSECGQQIRQCELKPESWRLESPAILRLLEKLRQVGKPLGEYVKGCFYNGVKSGHTQAFVVDRTTRDLLIKEHKSSAKVFKPYLAGRDLKRWRVQSRELWLIYVPWHFPLHEDATITSASPKAEREFKKLYPAIYRHLEQFKGELARRDKAETGIRYEWYAMARPRFEIHTAFEQPKIILGIFMNKPTYAFDTEGFCVNNAQHFIGGANPYLVAILNSNVCWWFLTHICTDLQNGYLQALIEYQIQIPIPDAPAVQQKPVERLVERILAAKQRDAAADVSALEREIDERVYRLYGLTAEEIELVEGVGK